MPGRSSFYPTRNTATLEAVPARPTSGGSAKGGGARLQGGMITSESGGRTVAATTKKPYEKPAIKKMAVMRIAEETIAAATGRLVCKQCSSCHGCR